MSDIEFIKKFSKITVRSACKKAGVNEHNFWGERVKQEKVKEIKNIIILAVIKLIEDELNEKTTK